MSRGTSSTQAPKKRKIKYPTIGADAAALQVSRGHLWEVLEGNRSSRSLLRRYRALNPGGKS